MFEGVEVGCCSGDTTACVCGIEERVIRAYSEGRYAVPMTAEQREFCIWEADKCGEGMYSREELQGYSDQALASAVLDAWDAYCKSQGLI